MRHLLHVAVALFVLMACMLPAGCCGPAPACHPHHVSQTPCPPPVSFGSCHAVNPYCLANPGRYAEPMHPVIGTNGAPYLLPQSGLKAIVNPPAMPPDSTPE